MRDSFDNTRDRLAKSEKQIREARQKREDLQRADDRAQREHLEKMSASSGQRLSLVDMLNNLSVTRAPMETGLDAISKIREQQALGRRTGAQHNRSHDAFEKAGGLEGFNRLHPESRPLARSMVPMDSGGAAYSEPRLNPSRAASPRGNYDFDSSLDPGRRQDSRFQWEDEFAPRLAAARVRDAEGRLRSPDARARDHWPSDAEPESIKADLQWLLAATRKLIEVVNRKEYARGRV